MLLRHGWSCLTSPPRARARAVPDIVAVIEGIRDEEIAILLVEQNSAMVVTIAHRAYVIDDGRTLQAECAADLDRPGSHAPPAGCLAPASGAEPTKRRAAGAARPPMPSVTKATPHASVLRAGAIALADGRDALIARDGES